METEVIFADPSSILKDDKSRSLSPMTSSDMDIIVSESDEDKINEELCLISSSSVRRKVNSFSEKAPVSLFSALTLIVA